MKLLTAMLAGLIYTSLFFISIAQATENHKVGQKNKEFTVKEIKIKKGDSIEFVNEDPFFHNVFSLSDASMFDLGSFPQGGSKKVVFEEAGEIEVECAIHPNMKMKVVVEEKE
ncbi:MAG: plastocyanin/azurin family copper-binding protein [Glaciecola sp.]|jgi:plastocyanin